MIDELPSPIAEVYLYASTPRQGREGDALIGPIREENYDSIESHVSGVEMNIGLRR